MSLKNLIPWRNSRNDSKEDLFPAPSINRIRDEMDRVFDQFLSDPWWNMGLDMPVLSGSTWAPAWDIAETEKEFVIRAEMPGMDPNDINVSITGDLLTLSGHKQQVQEEKNSHYYRSGCRYGAFCRSVRLPSSADPERVSAEYKNGVLTIRCGKTEDSAARRIPVSVSRS